MMICVLVHGETASAVFAHIEMIRKQLGEEIEENRLKEFILNGGKNKYRDAFLHANRLSLENYAVTMRRAVDEINPNIRLGFCAV